MYCEDYPCCGHTPQDPCGADGKSVSDWYDRLSSRGYDPYYDEPYD